MIDVTGATTFENTPEIQDLAVLYVAKCKQFEIDTKELEDKIDLELDKQDGGKGSGLARQAVSISLEYYKMPKWERDLIDRGRGF